MLILGKPLGIGIYSAAFKREILIAGHYDEMVASATRLNTPGLALGQMPGVHAMTDVTGFGLLGHASEMARGAGVCLVIEKTRVPVFAGARALAESGIRTGASGRNWNAVQGLVSGATTEAERDVFCDPQTSGGLLVACAPENADAALAAFAREGHAAVVIGHVEAGKAGVHLI